VARIVTPAIYLLHSLFTRVLMKSSKLAKPSRLSLTKTRNRKYHFAIAGYREK